MQRLHDTYHVVFVLLVYSPIPLKLLQETSNPHTFQVISRRRDTKSEPDERVMLASSPGTSGAVHHQGGSRPKSHSPTCKMPNKISFFSGNPSVESTKGILHIYKDR